MARTLTTCFVSVTFYVGWLLWATGHFNLPQVFGIALVMTLPLALTCFPHELNELVFGAMQKNGVAQTPVPSWILAALGWLLFLLLPPLIGVVVGH